MTCLFHTFIIIIITIIVISLNHRHFYLFCLFTIFFSHIFLFISYWIQYIWTVCVCAVMVREKSNKMYIKLIPKWLLQHHQYAVSVFVCLSQQVGGSQTRRRSMFCEILNKYTNLLFWLWALSFPSSLCHRMPSYAVYVFTALLCSALVVQNCVIYKSQCHVFIHGQNWCESAKVYVGEEKRVCGKINQILTNIFTARTDTHIHISN